MKALSIHPFYATMIAIGDKFIELRTWETDYRGWIMICSSAAKNKREREGLVCGHGIAIANLVDIRPYVDETDRDAAYLLDEETFEGYSWVFDSIVPIHPVPIKGQLRLFNVDYEVEDLKALEIDFNSEKIQTEIMNWWLDNGYIKEIPFEVD